MKLLKLKDQQAIKGLKSEIVRIDGRTPLLFIEIDGDSSERILLYGHYDKQPNLMAGEMIWVHGCQ